MNVPHFVLVEVDSLRQARGLALEALAQQEPYARPIRKVPQGYPSAISYGTAEFDKALDTARLMQRNNLMNCATVLCNSFGEQDAEAFERNYHENPDKFKELLARAFQFMGMCAAEVLIRKRHPPAHAGEHWTPTEFDFEGFLDGLDEVGIFQELIEGSYCPYSYFFNPYIESGKALIPEAKFFADLAAYSAGRNKKIALVPILMQE